MKNELYWNKKLKHSASRSTRRKAQQRQQELHALHAASRERQRLDQFAASHHTSTLPTLVKKANGPLHDEIPA